LIVAPPRTGKTTLLHHIADAVVKNHSEMKLIILLVDERPEEVTDFKRSHPNAEIIASSNDSDIKSHTRIAQLAIERAKRLVEAGKHVLCEKPPTMNAAEMKVLREEAAKRNLIYSFSRQGRFSPAMRAAKAAVEEGRLGKIYHAKATFVRSRGIPVGIGDWFTERKRSGGGALIDIGIHALDSVWYLMGTPQPTAVNAQVFRNFEHLVKVPVFDVEDAAFAFIRFNNGAIVQLETSWAGNLTDDIPPRKYFGQELINSMVYGTKASVRLNPVTLFEDRHGELVTVPLHVKEDEPSGFELQLRNFIDSINGEAAPINNADQAVALMEMLDAIYASSAIGREMPIT